MMDSYDFNIDSVGPGGTVSMPHMNLSQGKIPDENLTLEQVSHILLYNSLCGQVAQVVELHPLDRKIRGSNPCQHTSARL
jgi:hypothetical protein